MTPDEFSYHALFRAEASQPAGLIAMRVWMGPLQAVIWSVPKQKWTYNPAVAAPWIFDDQYANQQRSVSRQEAQRIAREQLGTELPNETVLHQICATGAASRS
jgi:hypothetical protein